MIPFRDALPDQLQYRLQFLRWARYSALNELKLGTDTRTQLFQRGLILVDVTNGLASFGMFANKIILARDGVHEDRKVRCIASPAGKETYPCSAPYRPRQWATFTIDSIEERFDILYELLAGLFHFRKMTLVVIEFGIVGLCIGFVTASVGRHAVGNSLLDMPTLLVTMNGVLHDNLSAILEYFWVHAHRLTALVKPFMLGEGER